jgi:hypothetical protein
MKKSLLSIAILLSSFANANDGIKSGNLSLYDQKIITMAIESQEYPDIKKELLKEDYNKVLISLQNISKETESIKLSSIISESIESVLKNQYPRLNSYWEDKVSVNGMIINQSDSLFDLERMKFSTPEYSSKKIDGTELSIYEQQSPIYTNEIPETSLLRMVKGKPGVGPDGKNILICRFVHFSDAPYYEMSYSDASSFIFSNKTNMTLSQACISSTKHMSTYWRHRVNDFKITNRY